jgi:hypothetical protein
MGYQLHSNKTSLVSRKKRMRKSSSNNVGNSGKGQYFLMHR